MYLGTYKHIEFNFLCARLVQFWSVPITCLATYPFSSLFWLLLLTYIPLLWLSTGFVQQCQVVDKEYRLDLSLSLLPASNFSCCISIKWICFIYGSQIPEQMEQKKEEKRHKSMHDIKIISRNMQIFKWFDEKCLFHSLQSRFLY